MAEIFLTDNEYIHQKYEISLGQEKIQNNHKSWNRLLLQIIAKQVDLE